MDIGGAVNTTSDKYLWVSEALMALLIIALIIGAIITIKAVIDESKKNKK